MTKVDCGAGQERAISEAQLIGRILQRETTAMGMLYDRYGSMVHGRIRAIVRNHHDAEDLVQETFMRVWTRIGRYDLDRGSLSTWIGTIARNRALDYVRSARVRGECFTLNPRALQELQDCSSLLPTNPYEHCFPSVRAALPRLTAMQREVLNLAYFEGMSQTEIATSLDQPLGTIKTWARTALISLRREVAA